MTTYTKDTLIETIINQQKTTTEFMDRITSALEALNDNNILHKQVIDINTSATKDMTTAIKVQSAYLKMQANYIRWITIVLVAAIIVLAGAEKALKFIPLIK